MTRCNSFLVGLALISLCLTSSVAAKSFYAIASNLFNEDFIFISTVAIDPATGTWNDVMTNMLYYGGVISNTGISAFDQVSGRYFYVTGGGQPALGILPDSPFLYTVDIVHKAFLPPLSLGATAVTCLKYDDNSGLLYALASFDGIASFVLLEMQLPNTARLVAQPPQFLAQTNFWPVGTLYSDTYYMAGQVGSSQLANYAIATINITTGQVEDMVNIDTNNCTLEPSNIWYDSQTNEIIGIASTPTGTYYFIRVNLKTGGCIRSLLQTGGANIVINAATFDPIAEEVWYLMDGMIVNDEYVAVLQGLNIRTGVTKMIPLGATMSPLNLELSYFY